MTGVCKLCKLSLWVIARFLFGLVGPVAGCDYIQCVSSVLKDYDDFLSLSGHVRVHEGGLSQHASTHRIPAVRG